MACIYYNIVVTYTLPLKGNIALTLPCSAPTSYTHCSSLDSLLHARVGTCTNLKTVLKLKTLSRHILICALEQDSIYNYTMNLA